MIPVLPSRPLTLLTPLIFIMRFITLSAVLNALSFLIPSSSVSDTVIWLLSVESSVVIPVPKTWKIIRAKSTMDTVRGINLNLRQKARALP